MVIHLFFQLHNQSQKHFTAFALVITWVLALQPVHSQIVIGREMPVTVNGYTAELMEPFVDGNAQTLFFNSLNSGGNTNLHYASRVNDTTFTYQGLVNGTHDTSSNHLDAVASLDNNNRFYWVSLRNYPTVLNNLHTGYYANGSVTSVKRVYGDFNKNQFAMPFGWLVMDAAISRDGSHLYYCNAQFDFSNTQCVGVPCRAQLGIAAKVNDTTFQKMTNEAQLLQQVNDTNYLVYAPQLSSDGLELHFTRLMRGSANSEICVALRTANTAPFGVPQVLYAHNGYLPEASTLTDDKTRIYYHQKNNASKYSLFMRYRTLSTGIIEIPSLHLMDYYQPITATIDLTKCLVGSATITVYNWQGEIIDQTQNKSISLINLADGMYVVAITNEKNQYMTKLVKYTH